MIKISVIVPIYNVEKYLDKCLYSLVNQTLKDIEIILVNDGSTDNSENVINKYLKEHENIKYYKKQNGGQGSARNLGLKKANGEYISYIDSDDYIETDMLEKMYYNAVNNNSDIVICNMNVVNEDYKLICKDNCNLEKYGNTIKDNPRILFDKTGVCNKIYKRNFLIKTKAQFREKLWYEDIDFSFKVLISASKITFLNCYLYNYLVRNNSTMNNQNSKRNLELIFAFNEILNYLKKEKIYSEYEKEVEFMCISHLYIACSVRLLLIDMKNKKYLETINEYINSTFPNFKNNKYIKNYLSFSKKIIYYFLNLKFYSIIRLMFIIKKRG